MGNSGTVQPAVDLYLESLRIDRGAAEKTIEAYRRDLGQFAESLGKSPPRLAAIRAEDLDLFLASLKDRGQNARSVARKTSSLRQFFKFCCLEGLLDKNPAETIVSPRPSRTLPKCLTPEEIAALLAQADQGLAQYREPLSSALRLRDRAMVYLLYATGLRASELVGLRTGDVDLPMDYLRVKGKGEKERIVPFARAAGDLLAAYLAEARPGLQARGEAFFVNRHGTAMTRQACWLILRQLAMQAGIQSPLSPHVLRHSFATHLMAAGMGLRSLQMLLGHSDLTTTQIYTHISPEHLRTSHRKFHPRGE